MREDGGWYGFLGSQGTSFVLGIVASYFLWWLVQHYWTPTVRFSSELCKYELPSGEFIYQCAFENAARRDIIDLEIYVRVGIENFLGASHWAHHIIRSNTSRVPVLSPGKSRRVRLYDMREAIEFIDVPSKSLRDKIVHCASMEEILSLGTDAVIRVHVFGYDSFSGTRKHFQSPTYRKNNIRRGRFDGLNVVFNDKLENHRSVSAAKA